MTCPVCGRAPQVVSVRTLRTTGRPYVAVFCGHCPHPKSGACLGEGEAKDEALTDWNRQVALSWGWFFYRSLRCAELAI